MNIQEKAFHIIYNIIEVVIKWDKNQLSDKEAMNGIVSILAFHAEDLSEKEREQIRKKILKNENEIKKQNHIKFQKIVPPIAISVIFIGVLFGTGILNNFFILPENQTSVNEKKIGFEQLNEPRSDKKEKILNSTIIEEFSNITNFNQG
jgi:hypothetical protein